MRPRLLDLFCGAGGLSMGYHRAGFDVTGVDIEPHADYPFELLVGDAMDYARDIEFLSRFDVVHGSPPCPRYSVAGSIGSYDPADKPDLVPPFREAMAAWGGTWVMENVPGAPMPDAITLCGWSVGVPMRRHRLFESSEFLISPGCSCPIDPGPTVFGHESSIRVNGQRVHIPLSETKRLMGVEWMTSRDDVSDCVPPAYAQFVGDQLMDHLKRAAA